jgi:hypothetical protein
VQWGALQGSLAQSRTGIDFGGEVSVYPIPGLTIVFEGASDFLGDNPKTRINFETAFRTSHPLDLGKVHKSAAGIEIQGKADINGRILADQKGISGRMESAIKIDRFKMKNGLSVEGMELNLTLTDLLSLKSAPNQSLKFGGLTAGKIRISDGDFRFQIESSDSVLVEKGGFKWCNGSITAQSLRIQPTVKDYEVVLYGDRLNLAQLLEQLGAAKAEGSGAVNGKIPVRFKDGNFFIEDGFLYSTPGDGGAIHARGTEFLTDGIAKNSLQFSQIDLAVEALKDYEYQWVKIRMSSEGEELKLRMAFDGKPQNPLPFSYNSETGGFVRMDSGRMSRFQGIQLNLNVSLPLNKILKYRGVMDKLNKK